MGLIVTGGGSGCGISGKESTLFLNAYYKFNTFQLFLLITSQRNSAQPDGKFKQNSTVAATILTAMQYGVPHMAA